MLNVLREIVQEAAEAQDLEEVLALMVHKVATSIKTQACSVYLVDTSHNNYRLVASVGFKEGVNGQVTLGFSEGLVGLVGEREEPINLSNACEHPRYRYFPETGEERYKAFLGVPIIHQRKLVGIIVVQQREPRKFDEGEEAFLVTISAHLAGHIAHAQTKGLFKGGLLSEDRLDQMVLRGVPGASGVGIGQAVVVYVSADLQFVPERKTDDPQKERESFTQALEATREEIRLIKKRVVKSLPLEEQVLFDAYLGILDSQSILQEVEQIIEQGFWAPWAVRKVIKGHVKTFETMEDPYLRERASDLKDIGRRILANIQSKGTTPIEYPKHTILVSEEVTASALAQVPEGQLVGIVSAKGSGNSHVAILARAMGIPTVMGVTGLPVQEVEDKSLVVDGYNGEIYVSPSKAMLKEFSRLVEEERELVAGLDELRELRAETPDGTRVPLCVNTGLVGDYRPSLKVGAEGVGLYRTEVPFMIRDRFPGEEEQYHIYRQLLETFAPRPVTIRTLDVGGDKILPYFPVKEENPFLGWRGIRVTLDHPEIFLVQLRALLRANAGLHNLRILFPMVSGISEVDEALRLLRQAHREVVEEGANSCFPLTGVMIEVPSAVYQSERLAQRVDFLSVGSNDLTQYLLAVDRNNVHVANLYDCLHPAVIQALRHVTQSAHIKHKKVSICGEMAGDPAATILLLAMGFDMLSMNATSLPKIKWVIRNFTLSRARLLLEEVSCMEHSRDIRLHLETALEQAGLGGLVRAGK